MSENAERETKRGLPLFVRQLDWPGREPGIAWQCSLHATDDCPPYPLAVAYVSDFRAAGLGMVLDFIWVPDHLRRSGYATELLARLRSQWPDLNSTDGISEAGEALVARVFGD